jgi:hypothetical protein
MTSPKYMEQDKARIDLRSFGCFQKLEKIEVSDGI